MIACMGNIPYVNGCGMHKAGLLLLEIGTVMNMPQSYVAYGNVSRSINAFSLFFFSSMHAPDSTVGL
ncbi:hypothetical protein KDAU_56840 [Dictyobacter aurantiacus]|uniref:Uncharacterized protein n=1 Tax=Dictyobacter aurantiacus TaxID=1936993 RepID=A0A401ZNB3_9CHLR|nr:hypothetical protein KDAU_56840 [Dictyobacter aurantiacus]